MNVSEFLASFRKSHPGKESGAALSLPPVMPAGPAPAAAVPPVPKKESSGYRHYLHLIKGAERSTIDDYRFEQHGSLVQPRVTEEYEQIDEYWIDKGRSLVIIALNRKTNQKEYLLFEPALSEFEYELLERLHEDLRMSSFSHRRRSGRIGSVSSSRRCMRSSMTTASRSI